MIETYPFPALAQATEAVSYGNLSGAFTTLYEFLGSDAPELVAEIKKLEKRYFYFLRFLAESDSTFSPEQDLDAFGDATMMLIGKAYETAYIKRSDSAVGAQLRFERLRPEETFESVVSDFLSELARLRKDPGALTDTRARATLERLGNDIFKRIWAAQVINHDMEELIKSLIPDTSIPFYYREQMVSAVGLGYTPHTANSRMAILESAMASENRRIALNAEIWYTICSILDEEFISEVDSPHNDLIYHAMKRVIYSLPTKLPDIINLGHLMSGKSLENPDLSEKEYEAIHKIQEAQERGEDIFAGMMGGIRNFPFFSDIANWFMPFHSDNSALADIVDGEGAVVADMIENVAALSDFDKYGLLLSLSMMPESMRRTQLSAMVDGLHKLSGTEEFRQALDEAKLTDTMYIGRTVSNIYRFLTDNKIGQNLDFASDIKNIYRDISLSSHTYRDYSPEMELIRRLSAAGEDKLACELANKIYNLDLETALAAGISYERLNNNERANLEYSTAFEKYPESIDALVGYIRTEFKKGATYEVINILEDKEDMIAENAELLRFLGLSYLHDNQPEQGLLTMQNLDYVANDSESKALLAIALTACGDYENADIYFISALEDIASPDIFVYRGIHLWLSGKRKEAVAFFSKAFEALGDTDSFRTVIWDASQLLNDRFRQDMESVIEIIKYKIYEK